MNLNLLLKNKKGSFQIIEDDSDDGTYKYPLASITFPTDHSYIEGYNAEDGLPLQVFSGSGTIYGSFKIWTYDIPEKTIFCMNVSEVEWDAILKEYKPVLKSSITFKDKEVFEEALKAFKA